MLDGLKDCEAVPECEGEFRGVKHGLHDSVRVAGEEVSRGRRTV